ncbi:MAG: heavy metal transport/detoxification protein [Campylobacteraceae bacterium]|nr:heavy metal transport/detoxification protein [Campylobacteraceae bacterium]
MLRHFQALNINCSNCSNTIKVSLEDDFGKIEVDLTKEPKVVSVDLSDDAVKDFKTEMKDLGFEVIGEVK